MIKKITIEHVNRLDVPYTAIPNWLLDKFINGEFKPIEAKILLYLYRKTIGYKGKNGDPYRLVWHRSYRKLAADTKCSEKSLKNVLEACKSLIARGYIEAQFDTAKNCMAWSVIPKNNGII